MVGLPGEGSLGACTKRRLGYKSHLREVAERGRKLREKLAQIRSSSEKKRRYLRKETAQRRGSSMKRYISEKVAWRRLGLGT